MIVQHFSKELLRSILYEECDEPCEVIRDDITSTGRWSTHHNFIFKYDGKLYQTRYSKGATEYQDESPWEYEDMVECVEVEEYEKIVIDYRQVE